MIHIQDAHCNYAAQRKISEIIEYLNREYGVSAVNLEGGARDYDLSLFTDIADTKIRATVSDHFVKEGLVNGAEYFAVNNPGKVTLWGIEDTKLYIDNLKVFRGSLRYKEEADRYIKNLSYILTNLKMKIYSKDLLDFDTKYSQYKASNIEFKDYVNYLIRLAGARAVDIKSYPNIHLLHQALGDEAGIDFRKANNERDELIDALRKRLSRASVEELVVKTVEFGAEKISPKDFYGYLADKASSVNVDLKGYPEFQKYIVYISMYDAMEKHKVMAEVDALEIKIKESLFENDAQRELASLSKNLAMLRNIFNISLTRDDYRYYKDNEDSFRAAAYAQFIGAQAPRHAIAATLDEEIARLDAYREEMARFYEYSFRRDEAFVKNIKLERHGAAIIVTGGFHTENLAGLFKKHGIAYVSIMPNFNNSDGYECAYFKILSGEKNLKIKDALPSVLSMALAIPDQLNPEIMRAAGGLVSAARSLPTAGPKELRRAGAPTPRMADPGNYFTPTPDSAPTDKMREQLLKLPVASPIRSHETSTASLQEAKRRMRNAREGLGEKRKPIDVRRIVDGEGRPTGRYYVEDGNATVTAALDPEIGLGEVIAIVKGDMPAAPIPAAAPAAEPPAALTASMLGKGKSAKAALGLAPFWEEPLFRGLSYLATLSANGVVGMTLFTLINIGFVFAHWRNIKALYGERAPPIAIVKALVAPVIVTAANLLILHLFIGHPFVFLGVSILNHWLINFAVVCINALRPASQPIGFADLVPWVATIHDVFVGPYAGGKIDVLESILPQIKNEFKDLNNWDGSNSLVKELARMSIEELEMVEKELLEAGALPDHRARDENMRALTKKAYFLAERLVMVLQSQSWLAPTYSASQYQARGFWQDYQTRGMYERDGMVSPETEAIINSMFDTGAGRRNTLLFRNSDFAMSALLNRLAGKICNTIVVSNGLETRKKELVARIGRVRGSSVSFVDYSKEGAVPEEKGGYLFVISDQEIANGSATKIAEIAKSTDSPILYYGIGGREISKKFPDTHFYGLHELKGVFAEGIYSELPLPCIVNTVEPSPKDGHDRFVEIFLSQGDLTGLRIAGGLLDSYTLWELMFLVGSRSSIQREKVRAPIKHTFSEHTFGKRAETIKDLLGQYKALEGIYGALNVSDEMRSSHAACLRHIQEAMTLLGRMQNGPPEFDVDERNKIVDLVDSHRAVLRMSAYLRLISATSPDERRAMTEEAEARLERAYVAMHEPVAAGQKGTARSTNAILCHSAMAALRTMSNVIMTESAGKGMLVGNNVYFELENVFEKEEIRPVRIDERKIEDIIAQVGSGRFSALFIDPIANAMHFEDTRNRRIKDGYPAFDLKALVPRLCSLTYKEPFYCVIDIAQFGAAFKIDSYLDGAKIPENLHLILVDSLQKLNEDGLEMSTGGMLTVVSGDKAGNTRAVGAIRKVRDEVGTYLGPRGTLLLDSIGFDKERLIRRTSRIHNNALELARFLRAHIGEYYKDWDVRLIYPGIRTHPDYEIARKNYEVFGPFLFLDFGTPELNGSFNNIVSEELAKRGIINFFRDSYGFNHISFIGYYGMGALRVSLGKEDESQMQLVKEAFVVSMTRLNEQLSNTSTALKAIEDDARIWFGDSVWKVIDNRVRIIILKRIKDRRDAFIRLSDGSMMDTGVDLYDLNIPPSEISSDRIPVQIIREMGRKDGRFLLKLNELRKRRGLAEIQVVQAAPQAPAAPQDGAAGGARKNIVDADEGLTDADRGILERMVRDREAKGKAASVPDKMVEGERVGYVMVGYTADDDIGIFLAGKGIAGAYNCVMPDGKTYLFIDQGLEDYGVAMEHEELEIAWRAKLGRSPPEGMTIERAAHILAWAQQIIRNGWTSAYNSAFIMKQLSGMTSEQADRIAKESRTQHQELVGQYLGADAKAKVAAFESSVRLAAAVFSAGPIQNRLSHYLYSAAPIQNQLYTHLPQIGKVSIKSLSIGSLPGMPKASVGSFKGSATVDNLMGLIERLIDTKDDAARADLQASIGRVLREILKKEPRFLMELKAMIDDRAGHAKLNEYVLGDDGFDASSVKTEDIAGGEIKDGDPLHPLTERGELKKLLFILSMLRLAYSQYMLDDGIVDENGNVIVAGNASQAPLEYALANGLVFPYFESADGSSVALCPVAESYRRHILVFKDKDGRIMRAHEVKIPGDYEDKRVINRMNFDLARKAWDTLGERSGVVKPAVIVSANGVFGLYGHRIKADDPKDPLNSILFEYEDGRRLARLRNDRGGGFEVVNAEFLSVVLGNVNAQRIKDGKEPWTLEQLRNDIVSQTRRIARQLLDLGYTGSCDDGNDLHIENFRLLRNGTVVAVADFGAFEERELSDREKQDDIDGLVFPLLAAWGLDIGSAYRSMGNPLASYIRHIIAKPPYYAVAIPAGMSLSQYTSSFIIAQTQSIFSSIVNSGSTQNIGYFDLNAAMLRKGVDKDRVEKIDASVFETVIDLQKVFKKKAEEMIMAQPAIVEPASYKVQDYTFGRGYFDLKEAVPQKGGDKDRVEKIDAGAFATITDMQKVPEKKVVEAMMTPPAILKPTPYTVMKDTIFGSMNKFLPKIKPVGFTAVMALIAADTVAFVLGALDLIGPDTAGAITAVGIAAGAVLAIAAFAYKYYLTSTMRQENAFVPVGPRPLQDIRLIGRVLDAFRYRGAVDNTAVTIVDDMTDVSVEDFETMILARADLDDRAKVAALNGFRHGYWLDRSGDRAVLYVHTKSTARWLAERNLYLNNALYDNFTGKLFVLRSAAQASDLGFGLVMAHERGKRDFFRNRFLSRHFGWRTAELTGNLYELWFFMRHSQRRAAPESDRGIVRMVLFPVSALAVMSALSLNVPALTLAAILVPFASLAARYFGNLSTLWSRMRAAVNNLLDKLFGTGPEETKRDVIALGIAMVEAHVRHVRLGRANPKNTLLYEKIVDELYGMHQDGSLPLTAEQKNVVADALSTEKNDAVKQRLQALIGAVTAPQAPAPAAAAGGTPALMANATVARYGAGWKGALMAALTEWQFLRNPYTFITRLHANKGTQAWQRAGGLALIFASMLYGAYFSAQIAAAWSAPWAAVGIIAGIALFKFIAHLVWDSVSVITGGSIAPLMTDGFGAMTLLQSQEMRLELKLIPVMKLEQNLYIQREDEARKLWERAAEQGNIKHYEKHGLKFSYAVVSRKDLAECNAGWIADECGHAFSHCLYDPWDLIMFGQKYAFARGTWLLFVVKDLNPGITEQFIEYAAVHERGEQLTVGDHHMASKLEFAVAKSEGMLNEYLRWIRKNVPRKLADIFHYRKFGLPMPEEASEDFKVLLEEAKNTPEAGVARDLADSFEWPARLLNLLQKYEDANGEVAYKISEIRRAVSGAEPGSGTAGLDAYLNHIERSVRDVMSRFNVRPLQTYLNRDELAEHWDEEIVKGAEVEALRKLALYRERVGNARYTKELAEVIRLRGFDGNLRSLPIFRKIYAEMVNVSKSGRLSMAGEAAAAPLDSRQAVLNAVIDQAGKDPQSVFAKYDIRLFMNVHPDAAKILVDMAVEFENRVAGKKISVPGPDKPYGAAYLKAFYGDIAELVEIAPPEDVLRVLEEARDAARAMAKDGVSLHGGVPAFIHDRLSSFKSVKSEYEKNIWPLCKVDFADLPEKTRKALITIGISDELIELCRIEHSYDTEMAGDFVRGFLDEGLGAITTELGFEFLKSHFADIAAIIIRHKDGLFPTPFIIFSNVVPALREMIIVKGDQEITRKNLNNVVADIIRIGNAVLDEDTITLLVENGYTSLRNAYGLDFVKEHWDTLVMLAVEAGGFADCLWEDGLPAAREMVITAGEPAVIKRNLIDVGMALVRMGKAADDPYLLFTERSRAEIAKAVKRYMRKPVKKPTPAAEPQAVPPAAAPSLPTAGSKELRQAGAPETRERTIIDIAPIEESGGAPFVKRAAINSYVEEPLVAASESLFDMYIETIHSSANRKDLAESNSVDGKYYASLTINYETLDEDNKAAVDRVIEKGGTYRGATITKGRYYGDGTEYVDIGIEITRESTVKEVSAKAADVVKHLFVKQKFVGAQKRALTLDQMRERHPRLKTINDILEMGILYDKKSGLFFACEEDYRRLIESGGEPAAPSAEPGSGAPAESPTAASAPAAQTPAVAAPAPGRPSAPKEEPSQALLDALNNAMGEALRCMNFARDKMEDGDIPKAREYARQAIERYQAVIRDGKDVPEDEHGSSPVTQAKANLNTAHALLKTITDKEPGAGKAMGEKDAGETVESLFGQLFQEEDFNRFREIANEITRRYLIEEANNGTEGARRLIGPILRTWALSPKKVIAKLKKGEERGRQAWLMTSPAYEELKKIIDSPEERGFSVTKDELGNLYVMVTPGGGFSDVTDTTRSFLGSAAAQSYMALHGIGPAMGHSHPAGMSSDASPGDNPAHPEDPTENFIISMRDGKVELSLQIKGSGEFRKIRDEDGVKKELARLGLIAPAGARAPAAQTVSLPEAPRDTGAQAVDSPASRKAAQMSGFASDHIARGSLVITVTGVGNKAEYQSTANEVNRILARNGIAKLGLRQLEIFDINSEDGLSLAISNAVKTIEDLKKALANLTRDKGASHEDVIKLKEEIEKARIVVYAPEVDTGRSGLKAAARIRAHYGHLQNITIIADAYTDCDPEKGYFTDILSRVILSRMIAFYYECVDKNNKGRERVLEDIKELLVKIGEDNIDAVEDLFRGDRRLSIRPVNFETDFKEYKRMNQEVATAA